LPQQPQQNQYPQQPAQNQYPQQQPQNQYPQQQQNQYPQQRGQFNQSPQQDQYAQQRNQYNESPQQVISPVSPISPVPEALQTSFRKPVWPPANTRQYLPTSTQSIHWTTSKGSTKFVWPPPKAYTSYDYEHYTDQEYGTANGAPPTRGEAQYKAQAFMDHPTKGPVRVNPRSPGRLAAEQWEPYMGKYEEDSFAKSYVNPRKTRRFSEVITESNATRLPPTYRTPPGTQHVELSY
jgi:hypothetical protein